MSRRARARREAMEAKLLALCPTDETDDMDWEDADFDSLAVYREAESTESHGMGAASALLDHTTENQTADYVRRKKARKTGAVR